MLSQKAPLFWCRLGSRAEEEAAGKQDEGLGSRGKALCVSEMLVCSFSLGDEGWGWGEVSVTGLARDGVVHSQAVQEAVSSNKP